MDERNPKITITGVKPLSDQELLKLARSLGFEVETRSGSLVWRCQELIDQRQFDLSNFSDMLLELAG
jgi:hypothetical protein